MPTLADILTFSQPCFPGLASHPVNRAESLSAWLSLKYSCSSVELKTSLETRRGMDWREQKARFIKSF